MRRARLRSLRALRLLASMGLVLAMLAVAACGSDDDGSAGTTGGGSETTAAGGGAESGLWSEGGVGAADEPPGDPETIPTEFTAEMCGDRPMIVGYNDGVGSNGFRRAARATFERWTEVCPNIERVIFTDAQGDAQKQVSDFNALVAQGANVIVTIADAGPALLPAIRRATGQGVAVSAMSIDPGGTPGEDYAALVRYDENGWGRAWARWTCERLPDGGNVVFFGGPPGVASSQSEMEGIREVFAGADCQGVRLLDPAPVSTNWTVEGAQKAAAAILAKYPRIDAAISDFAGGAEGALAAWRTAGREMPPWAVSDDSNSFTCKVLRARAPIMGTSGAPGPLTLVSLSKAVAKYQEIADASPAKFDAIVTMDSNGEPEPICDPEFPPGTTPSWGFSAAELKGLM